MTDTEQSTLTTSITKLVYLDLAAEAKARNALALSRFRHEPSPPAEVAGWEGEASAYKTAIAIFCASFHIDSRKIYGGIRVREALRANDVKEEEISWFIRMYSHRLDSLAEMTYQQILDEFIGAQYDEYS